MAPRHAPPLLSRQPVLKVGILAEIRHLFVCTQMGSSSVFCNIDVAPKNYAIYQIKIEL